MGAGAYIVGHEFTRNGKMKRGPVNVGAGCTIGLKARLGPHVTATAGSKVPALTSAMTGETFLTARVSPAVNKGQAWR